MKILITGGHTGIGLELTKKLLIGKHKIGLLLRNRERKNNLPKNMNTENIDFFFADLSDQKSIVDIADEIIKKWHNVDIIFNNAGVLLDSIYLSKQENEMHFEVNTLAPLILSMKIWEKTKEKKEIKIINTVTDFLHKKKKLVSKTILEPVKNRKLIGAYLQSKLALCLLMNDWGKKEEKVMVYHVTPGPTKTKMTSGPGMPIWLKPIRNLFFAMPKKSANHLYNVAFNKNLSDESGSFIQKGKVYSIPFQIDSYTKNKLLERIKVQLNS